MPTSTTRRAVAVLVAALVLIGVAVLATGVAQGPSASAPSPTATATASTLATAAPTPTASAGPSASVQPSEEQVLAMLREIEEQVIEIRGLPPAGIGPPDIISREELRVELERIFAEEYPPEEQERDNIALRALGLLEPGQDLLELQLQLLGDQVLGFYDDVDKRMVIVTDAGLDAEARLTYAHEYTHALQDAAFGLDSLETDAVGEDDRGLARIALIEGDATVTMLAWAFAHLTQHEVTQALSGSQLPDTTGIPSWMIEQLQFPYTEGTDWAGALAGEGSFFAPDFDEIDAAYEDPPDSTEQIIDLEAWSRREPPVRVEVVDLAAALGDGWEEVDATPIGEASIRIMLGYLGVGSGPARVAADGWGGDRAVIVSGPDDAFALAWRLAWDTPADAEEFEEAYRVVVDGLPFPATVQLIGDREILVVHASTEGLLERTVSAAQ